MSSLRKPLQLTLALIKPDVTSMAPVLQLIKNRIIEEDFIVVRSKQLLLNRSQAELFYKEHEGKFFHNRLVTFMSSGNVLAMILANENAISKWRKLLGPTKVYRTMHEQPDTIRGMFGLSDTRNCAHGSDAPQSAEREIKFFFPDFDVNFWIREESKKFMTRNYTLDETKFVHSL